MGAAYGNVSSGGTGGQLSEKVIRYVAAGGAIIQQGHMLLLDRPGRGEVRLPKGHLEPGESAEAAALREVGEETGYADLAIAADLGHRLVTFDRKGKRYIRDEHYFLMSLRSDRRQPQPTKDAAQFRVVWVPLDEAVDRLTFEAEREAARRAIAAAGGA